MLRLPCVLLYRFLRRRFPYDNLSASNNIPGIILSITCFTRSGHLLSQGTFWDRFLAGLGS